MAKFFAATGRNNSEGTWVAGNLDAINVDDNSLSVGDVCLVAQAADYVRYYETYFSVYVLSDDEYVGNSPPNRIKPLYSTGTTAYSGSLFWQICTNLDEGVAEE